MNSFFITGVQRSGTTLLSVLLDNHPEVLMERRSIAFRIITCFNNLYELSPFNPTVPKDKFTSWLVENDIDNRLSKLIDTENIDQYPTIRSLIKGSIDKQLRTSNKLIWGDKSPNLQHFLNDLLLLIPDTKIIHIVRDGRATAISMHKRSSQHLKWCAQTWLEGNTDALVNKQIIGAEQYLIIRYEDLIRQPAITYKNICDFLNISFSPDFLKLVDEKVTDEEAYVKDYFDQSKIDAWKATITDSELKKIELIQGPMLTKLGYELSYPESLAHQPLSLRQKIYYKQTTNLRNLFRSKITLMSDRKLQTKSVSLRNRLAVLYRDFIRDFLSLEIFKSVSKNIFYKTKYYTPTEKINRESDKNTSN